MDDEAGEVTVLLTEAAQGANDAKERLFRMVQNQLRASAKKQMRGERPDHSLQATVLINDTFLRLFGEDVNIDWQNRQHFYRTAANVMRRLLIDHERKRRAQRRGGTDHVREALEPDSLGESDRLTDLLALDEALNKLIKISPRLVDVVVLHHFAGHTLKATAEILEVSLTTAKADWRMAKAWLYGELAGKQEDENDSDS